MEILESGHLLWRTARVYYNGAWKSTGISMSRGAWVSNRIKGLVGGTPGVSITYRIVSGVEFPSRQGSTPRPPSTPQDYVGVRASWSRPGEGPIRPPLLTRAEGEST